MKIRNIIIVVISMVLTSGLFAKNGGVFKSFDVQSAIVNYDINGSGKLSENSNLSIEGNSTLLFTDWGVSKLYKEKYVEMLTGAVKSTKTVQTLYSEENGMVYKVDFEKKKIEKTEDAVIKNAITAGKNLYQKYLEKMRANGKQVGDSVVLGYRCDEWLYKGKKRCFYKGVPLREESIISGVKVIKTAVSAEFDINISKDLFALPDFKEDQQKGFLLQNNKETLEKNKPRRDEKVEENASDTADISSEMEEAEIGDSDRLEKKLFEEQKTLLPKLLSEMQYARICLENAEYKDDANLCLDKLSKIEEQMSGEKNSAEKISVWSDSVKSKTMDELEEGILDMKRRMPCIHRSRNFDDLSICMQENSE